MAVATTASFQKISDETWEKVKALLDEHDPPKQFGRKRKDPRSIVDIVVWRETTGGAWNRIPAYLGDDGTAHRTVQRWIKAGIYGQILAIVRER